MVRQKAPQREAARMCVDRCHKSSPGHGAKAIGSGTRMTNSRASIQLTLHVANRVPIPRYRKSTLRMLMMISSLCSAPHDKKDNDVERSPSETLFRVPSSPTATSTEVETWFLLPFTRACLLATLTFRALHGSHIVSIPFETIEKKKKT